MVSFYCPPHQYKGKLNELWRHWSTQLHDYKLCPVFQLIKTKVESRGWFSSSFPLRKSPWLYSYLDIPVPGLAGSFVVGEIPPSLYRNVYCPDWVFTQQAIQWTPQETYAWEGGGIWGTRYTVEHAAQRAPFHLFGDIHPSSWLWAVLLEVRSSYGKLNGRQWFTDDNDDDQWWLAGDD